MQENTQAVNTESAVEENAEGTSRRTLLGRAMVAGLGLATLRMMPAAQAAKAPKQPEAETGHSYPMATPNARTEAQFRKGVMGIAMLSLATSEIAVDKATDAATKEFANFELREAIGVSKVLKEMNTPAPPMTANDRAILAKIKSTPPGEEFDKAYIKAQLGAHEFLRDLAESYLHNSTSRSMAEMHGRHIAMLTLATFKEHVVHCKNISKALQA